MVIVPIPEKKWLPPAPGPDAKENVPLILKLLADPLCSPYSKQDEYVIEVARKTDKLAQKCIGWPWICTLSISSFTPLVLYLLGAPPLVTTFSASASSACTFCLGMVASGRTTDASSTAKDEAQNVFRNLKERIEFIATYSLDRLNASDYSAEVVEMKRYLRDINVRRIRSEIGYLFEGNPLPQQFFLNLELAVSMASQEFSTTPCATSFAANAFLTIQ